MFVLKKIIGYLIMPVPVSLLLLTLGIILLLFTRRRVLSRASLGVGIVILLLASNRAVSALLSNSLESRYEPAPAGVAIEDSPVNSCAFVAVLGSGNGDATGLSAGQRLSPSARARLMEGLRLALLLPEARLIVSGPRNSDDAPTHARVQADAAVEIGFPRERILEIDTARDTAEETAALVRLSGPKKVALVTSAWHLPRAMRLAYRAGLTAVPCPADYIERNKVDTPVSAWITWDAEALNNSTRCWREYVGRAWMAITGKSGP